ncbi:hypothetical protein M407DRAFT_246944 [Tulasnella calospora MUT 4182]|uniref:Uncharacterized protein n=1 Tax=Tulasnella calospora MUT 4182 TaxID=1051891 RepID=A0A0C3Q2J9_9AGAM|nr:hypothetical protein M407DRAFT_246944 [Tulasnella calospora MUT 4182]
MGLAGQDVGRALCLYAHATVDAESRVDEHSRREDKASPLKEFDSEDVQEVKYRWRE